jgi:hypothetical protein
VETTWRLLVGLCRTAVELCSAVQKINVAMAAVGTMGLYSIYAALL